MSSSDSFDVRDAVAASPLLRELARGWWLLVIYGLIAVAFGLFALFRPAAVVISLTWLFGVMALVEGVFAVVALFTGNHSISRGWQALYAIASLGLGILTVLDPAMTAGVIVLLLAAWLIVAGVYRIAFAIRVRRHISGEWLIALSGLLAIVLGALFAMSPLAGLAVAGIWIGIGALLYGIVQLVAGFRLRGLRASG